MKPWEETWERDINNGVTCAIHVAGKINDEIICTDAGVYVRDEADMALISAAPELYRALGSAMAVLAANGIVPLPSADAAMKKARGER